MTGFLVGFLILANAHLITAMAGEKDEYFIAEAPTTPRKLGKHDHGYNLSPPESPEFEENAEHSTEASVSGVGEEASSVLKINHRHRGWIDEPVAGGVVILGGLMAAFLVTVFCYIRVTGRSNAEQPSSPTNSSILIPNQERSEKKFPTF